ncbi:MAG TPA: epimerase [Ruminococcaceae bacterium]|nr:epimerase [Oscillospiraceae bacterium]
MQKKWTEDKLNHMLTEPSQALIQDMKQISGDIMVLGAGGKMGPTLCILAKRALEKAGNPAKVIAVSRFSGAEELELLQKNGVETIRCDLLNHQQRQALPKAVNIIFMAGRKFGTNGQEWQTWAMNATLPAFIAEQFHESRIVVFSSGNIYPMVPIHTGGCTEADRPRPVGEYAMSCLARERAFEYAANHYGTKVFLYRLNFAVDLRYGVLYDLANNILQKKPISVTTPCMNCIWQGSANEIALRGLLHASSPALKMNVTGPEIISVKKAARRLGEILGKEPIFEGTESNDAYLNDASKAMELFGYPTVPVHTLIEWQGEWLKDGGRGLGKPTHFEERGGSY